MSWFRRDDQMALPDAYPANNQFERPSTHGPAAAQMSEFTPYLGITPKRSSGLPNEKSGTKVAPSNDWPRTLGER
jgi:hypothetical protein